MLIKATNNYYLLRQKHYEALKKDKISKNYFRASELGSADRKLVYSFFDNVPKRELTPDQIRVFENGDYVHERYQRKWRDMGCLLSLEKPISSKDFLPLKQYEWELRGRYDAILDANILRGYADGKVTLKRREVEDTEDTDIHFDSEYLKEIGYDRPSYKPIPILVDIKTMSNWGFKQLQENNLTYCHSYIDQLSVYMYLTGIPYSVLFVEHKEKNKLIEIQIVWTDLNNGKYTFEQHIHGEQTEGVLRTTIDTERFEERILNRLNRIWNIVKKLREAEKQGDVETIQSLIPEHCSNHLDRFPCAWDQGNVKCPYFDHCWNTPHRGKSLKTTKNESYRINKDYIEKKNSNDPFEGIFDSNGNLILDPKHEATFEVSQYIKDDKKIFDCGNCGFTVTYKRLINSQKRCPRCKFINIVN